MLLYELRKIESEIDKAATENKMGAEAYAVLQKGNASLEKQLSEVSHQLEEWKRQLDARRELQRLLGDTLPSDDYIRSMWWQEQSHFYEQLIGQIESYFKEENTGYITISLTALELLFIVRLSIDEGIMKADSLQTVFRSLSTTIGTEKQGLLSAESLKKRYSMWHEGSRKRIKQLLLNLIRRIDQGPTRG